LKQSNTLADTEVTLLIDQGLKGNQDSFDKLYQCFYSELKKMAQRQLRNENTGVSFGPTALAHEFFFKHSNFKNVQFSSRKEFLSYACKVMRNILVDHARKKRAEKRGLGQNELPFDESIYLDQGKTVDFFEFNHVLEILQEKDPRKAQIVELKFIVGLNNDEMADVLGVSSITIKRDWAMARAWLFKELKKVL